MSNDTTRQQSIHPRVVNGRTQHPMKNTCKATRQGPTDRAKAGMTRHLSQHPKDSATAKRLAEGRR